MPIYKKKKFGFGFSTFCHIFLSKVYQKCARDQNPGDILTTNVMWLLVWCATAIITHASHTCMLYWTPCDYCMFHKVYCSCKHQRAWMIRIITLMHTFLTLVGAFMIDILYPYWNVPPMPAAQTARRRGLLGTCS